MMENLYSTYKIRKMTVNDIKTIDNIKSDEFTIIYPDQIYHRFVKNFPNLSLVLEVDDNMEGFIIGSNTTSEGVHYGHITSIFISKGFRRCGFGAKLMTEFEENSKNLKCKYVNLFVNHRNTTAIEFYKKLDYYVHVTIPNYYDDTDDAFEMRKTLVY
uniref:N-terminal acetyltransferase, putative n=2 Tax=Theileria parva TaxID=5875 RepID=Q4N1V3_THEPA|eukprot:XP_764259.1 N-terminal acetyltransferase [Theileria parva strain Muguga]